MGGREVCTFALKEVTLGWEEVCTLALKEVTLRWEGGLYISSEEGDAGVGGRSVQWFSGSGR